MCLAIRPRLGAHYFSFMQTRHIRHDAPPPLPRRYGGEVRGEVRGRFGGGARGGNTGGVRGGGRGGGTGGR